METALNYYKLVKFKPKYDSKQTRKAVSILLALLILTGGLVWFAYAEENNIPMTGFAEFDAMYQHYMREDKPIVEDIMNPVNNIIFTLIELEMRVVGTLLLFLCVTAAAFAIWFVAKPEFAEEVSEVKMRKAGGEQIPIEEVKEFFLQFCPDIKANSGIADSYEYERPTFGLFVRDHLLKFVILFAVAIALQQSVIVTFIVKAGNALSFGAKYYTENTDFVGHVNTWTTAGKDYDPRYDTLTTEGRNKKKLYNAMYTALKREFPRERTAEFLELIGTQAANKVQELESGGNIKLNSQNFVPTADIVGYEVEPDKSDVMYRERYNVSDFIAGTNGLMSDGEKYMYVTILQYDEVQTVGTPTGTTNYTDSWGAVGSAGFPTKIDVKAETGYKYTATPEVEVTIRFTDTNGTSKTERATVRGTLGTNNTVFTVNYSALATRVNTAKGANGSVNQVQITGLGKATMTNTANNTTKTPQGTAYWYKGR